MPSPIRLICRWTRKKPTTGASNPTIAPAAKASRMNSNSNMDVGGVVPQIGKRRGRPVEDDSLADEHESLDDVLERAELVRDVEDGRAELAVEASEQLCKRLLRRDIDAGCGLVQRKQ